MGNVAHTLNLAAILQTPPMQASFVERGVVADGTTYLDSAGVIDADSPSFLGFASFQASLDTRARLVSWDGTTSSIAADSASGDGLTKPAMLIPCDNSGLNWGPSLGVAPGARIHMLFSGEIIDGNGIGNMVTWDATNGLQTATDTALAATTFRFTTGADPFYRILGRSNNNSQRFVGTVYRLSLWTGIAVPDVNTVAAQANFFSGGTLVDPELSRSTYGTGNLRFDCYGNAATWNSGAMPTGTFTSNGTFTDA